MRSVPFFLLFFIIAVSCAARRGGAPERIVAGIYVLALVGSASVGFWVVPGNFKVVPIGLFTVDTAMLLVLCLIAMRANRWWVIPAAACQLVDVLGHAAKLLDRSIIPDSYAFLVTIWSWPMVFLLALGTWAHRRRIADGVFVPDWKPISVPQRFRNPLGQQPS